MVMRIGDLVFRQVGHNWLAYVGQVFTVRPVDRFTAWDRSVGAWVLCR